MINHIVNKLFPLFIYIFKKHFEVFYIYMQLICYVFNKLYYIVFLYFIKMR